MGYSKVPLNPPSVLPSERVLAPVLVGSVATTVAKNRPYATLLKHFLTSKYPSMMNLIFKFPGLPTVANKFIGHKNLKQLETPTLNSTSVKPAKNFGLKKIANGFKASTTLNSASVEPAKDLEEIVKSVNLANEACETADKVDEEILRIALA